MDSNEIAGIKRAIRKHYKTEALIPAVDRLQAIERAAVAALSQLVYEDACRGCGKVMWVGIDTVLEHEHDCALNALRAALQDTKGGK